MIRRLLCLFVGHRWQFVENAAGSGGDQRCARCGSTSNSAPDPSYKGIERPRPGDTGYSNYPF